MTWTDIPDASLDPNKPARSVDIKAIRDNIVNVRDGNNKIVVFTASGTYIKPAGLRRVKVTVVGGGGGGAGCDAGTGSMCGHGGGGGGAAVKVIEAASLGASETVTVGGGGAGSGGNTTASSGGTSSFGAHCSATGGAGGTQAQGTTTPNAITTNVTAAGAGSGGDANISGHKSVFPEIRYDSSVGNYIPITSGEGGAAALGLGDGAAGVFYGNVNGTSASVYGSGGSGACSISANQVGGTGSAGIVIVEEFY
jgi:hypothetical protein